MCKAKMIRMCVKADGSAFTPILIISFYTHSDHFFFNSIPGMDFAIRYHILFLPGVVLLLYVHCQQLWS